jgi:endonuclease/exonuclease/phosphatase (EEP) superfamily protein YafD
MVYLAGMLATWAALLTLSESWLPATLLAYGPREVVLIPGVILMAFAAVVCRPALFPVAGAAVVALFGIMGLRLSPSAFIDVSSAPAERMIRVVSLNAQGGDVVSARLAAFRSTLAPDIVAFEECGERLFGALTAVSDGHAGRSAGGLCVWSRWPISQVDTMPRVAFARMRQLGFGGAANVSRFAISHPLGPLNLVVVHLETARKGLRGILATDSLFRAGAPRHQAAEATQSTRTAVNARIRALESERASVWAHTLVAQGPTIVAGDFNLPVESAIYRKFWRPFENAFDARGNGFGYTKVEEPFLHIRIDHILSADRWFSIRNAWVGDDVGSDHRPIIAELSLR